MLTLPHVPALGWWLPEGKESRPLDVMVVEDNEDGAESLGTLLRMQGYRVRLAFDGVQALDEIDASQPDVILLDIGLPRVDGFEVARQLRDRPMRKRPFIIAITGYGTDDDIRRAEEVGIDLHLTKPISFGDLRPLLVRLQNIVLPLS